MNKLLVLFIGILMAGCMATMPNNVSVHNSTFDGSTEVTVQPGFIYSDKGMMSYGHFMLGLHWSSSEPDLVFIKAEKPGEIINLVSEEGLMFNIDGEIVKLSSPSVTTSFDVSEYYGSVFTESSKGYIAKLSLINRLLSATDVKVKLVTGEGYMEGDFMADKPSSALRGFKEFIAKVESIK